MGFEIEEDTTAEDAGENDPQDDAVDMYKDVEGNSDVTNKGQ
jgi:hypothetical protein